MPETEDVLAGLEPDEPRERRNRRARAVGLLVFAAIVAAGLAGLFGVRTGTATAESADGLHLTVRHPRTARAGMAVALSIEVRRPGGFDGPIEVSVPTSYLAMFDENGREPAEDSATADAHATRWTYEPPEGDTLVITFDFRVEPGVQWGRDATIGVATGGDAVDVEVDTMTLDEVHEAARKRGYRSLADLEWVIVEADGKFSFIEAAGAGPHDGDEDEEGGHA